MAQTYADNPVIPGQMWRVHDMDRPQPPVVTPGSMVTRAPDTPPSDALVLFDGSSTDEWVSAKDGSSPCPWELVAGDAMRVVPKSGDIQTRRTFRDIQLHLEWSAPTEIIGEGQGRGNSGVFLMGLYEVQVLDCFENPTYPDGTTGALYGQQPALANACCKPGEWHHYDILWTAPRFAFGKLVSPAAITVIHNGVVLHHHRELMGPTRHKVTTAYDGEPETGPVKLQDHGDLVSFRNIWLREL